MHVARAVIIATGAMSPAEKVPGEEELSRRVKRIASPAMVRSSPMGG